MHLRYGLCLLPPSEPAARVSSALEVNRTTLKTLAAKQVSNCKNTDQYESVSVVLLRLQLHRPRDCSVTLWKSLVAMEKYVFCNCGRLFAVAR